MVSGTDANAAPTTANRPKAAGPYAPAGLAGAWLAARFAISLAVGGLSASTRRSAEICVGAACRRQNPLRVRGRRCAHGSMPSSIAARHGGRPLEPIALCSAGAGGGSSIENTSPGNPPFGRFALQRPQIVELGRAVRYRASASRAARSGRLLEWLRLVGTMGDGCLARRGTTGGRRVRCRDSRGLEVVALIGVHAPPRERLTKRGSVGSELTQRRVTVRGATLITLRRRAPAVSDSSRSGGKPDGVMEVMLPRLQTSLRQSPRRRPASMAWFGRVREAPHRTARRGTPAHPFFPTEHSSSVERVVPQVVRCARVPVGLGGSRRVVSARLGSRGRCQRCAAPNARSPVTRTRLCARRASGLHRAVFEGRGALGSLQATSTRPATIPNRRGTSANADIVANIRLQMATFR